MPVGDGHVFVDLHHDLLCGADDAPHVGDLGTQVEVAEFVHGCYLEERDIQFVVVARPVFRQFPEHHGQIGAAAGVAHVAVCRAVVSRNKAHLAVGRGRFVDFEGFVDQGRGAEDGHLGQFVRTLGQRGVDVHDLAAAQSEVDPVAGAYQCGRLICGNEFFFIVSFQ